MTGLIFVEWDAIMLAPQIAPVFALSIKQPWATLLVHGLKTIEIRRWPTMPRGRIFIHAGRVPDSRPDGWRHLPAHLAETARLGGGIIGSAELIRCIRYTDSEHFRAEQALHLNQPEWFEPPQMFGFQFCAPESTPFRACSGWFRFFKVEAEPLVP